MYFYTHKTPIKKADCSKRTYDIYDFKFSEKGEISIVKTGVFNLYEYIQTFKDDTDLKHILDMVNRTGDRGYLEVSPGFYGDISDMPENLHEAHNMMKSINGLKDNLKDLMNGEDIDTFLNTITEDKIQAYLDSKHSNTNIEVKDNESNGTK